MQEQDSMKIAALLEKTSKLKIGISLKEDQLHLHFPKGHQISPDVISELRENKAELIQFFQNNLHEPQLAINQTVNRGGGVNEEYFNITPTLKYWVDTSINEEFKEKERAHGSIIFTYRVVGDLNREALERAVSFVTRRHDSLRSVFVKVGTDYFLKVNGEKFELFSYFSDDENRRNLMDEIIRISDFSNHQFDLQVGPLFLVRLVKINDQEHILSFKIHHVIFDGVSRKSLLTDLIGTYKAFDLGRTPDLIPLQNQYQHYLNYENDYISNYHLQHKNYWNSLFPNLPDGLVLPFALPKRNSTLDQLSEARKFVLSEQRSSGLYELSKNSCTRLFVVLQATLKGFLNKCSGQEDLVIGTYVHGRDARSMEGQIGCYARTVIVRSVLSGLNSFDEIIKVVNQSNQDMWEYSACSLLDTMRMKLTEEQSIIGSFWRINVHFESIENGATNNTKKSEGFTSDNLELIPIERESESHIEIDMEFFFRQYPDALILDIKYNQGVHNAQSIQVFVSKYLEYIDHILAIN